MRGKRWDRDQAEFSLALQAYREAEERDLLRASRYAGIGWCGLAILGGIFLFAADPLSKVREVPFLLAGVAVLVGYLGWRWRRAEAAKARTAGAKLWVKASDIGLLLRWDGTVSDRRFPVRTRSLEELFASEPHD